MIERTFVMIKPDGVERGLVGEITKRIEQKGLKVVAMKMVTIDRKFAEKHYRAHVKKEFFKGLVDFIIQGPVVAMVVEGVHAVENVRKLVGHTSPFEAAPGTIRGDLAHLSMEYASKKNVGGANLIHAAGSKKEAEQEIKLWFKPEDILSYRRLDEKRTH